MSSLKTLLLKKRCTKIIGIYSVEIFLFIVVNEFWHSYWIHKSACLGCLFYSRRKCILNFWKRRRSFIAAWKFDILQKRQESTFYVYAKKTLFILKVRPSIKLLQLLKLENHIIFGRLFSTIALSWFIIL